MSIPRIALLVLAVALAGGCSLRPRLPSAQDLPFVHRIDVQQGNVITQEMLAQLQPGMDKAKVRFIMGTPLIVDSFHTNRWDYVYSFQEGGGTRVQRRVSLYFEDDVLVRVEGDVKPAIGRLEVRPPPAAMVEVPGEYRPGLVDRLKSKVGLAEEPLVPPVGEQEASADDAGGEQAQAANEEDEAKKDPELATAGSSVVVPESAPRKEKGFFGRLLDKVGIGDENRAPQRSPTGYRDPTDPDDDGGGL